MPSSSIQQSFPRTTSDRGLDALFHPRSIAIVGASGRPGNPFARPLEYLVEFGFDGEIHPVNPRYDSLRGRVSHASLADLPGPVDLALLMVPAAAAVELLPAVADSGAGAAVVFASGFGEAGIEGQQLQAELRRAADETGVRVLGPNCQGVLSTRRSMYGTFTAALELGPVRHGGLSYVGQSGAVGGSILSLAREQGLGLAAWASTGNQVDLTTVEIGRYLIDEDETTVLAMYLESAVDEREFRDLASRSEALGKTLIVLRSATSDAGAKAAASHTGAIVGDDASFRVTVREHGVVEATDIDDLVRLSHAHSSLPRSRGRSTAIVTTSGGAGSLAADKADESDLRVEELAEQTQQRLAELVPAFGAIGNPVDVTAQIFRASEVDDFLEVCRVTMDAQEVDALAIVLTLVTGELATNMAHGLANLIPESTKPITLAWSAAREQTTAAREILRDAGVPIFSSAQEAMRVLATLVAGERSASNGDDGWPAPELDSDAAVQLAALSGTVTESAGAALLDHAGIATPASFRVTDVDEADHLPIDPSAVYAVKVQSPGVLHKTERGGVLLDVSGAGVAGAVRQMFATFAGEQVDAVLVQEMVPPGLDMIVGATRSGPDGLPLVTVGLGGVTAELVRDTATTFAPVSPARARELVLGLRTAPLLTGWRGSAPVDLDALVDLVVRIGRLAELAGPRLQELEINPVRVLERGRGAIALDFLMTIAEEA